jgi:hypothetical protein
LELQEDYSFSQREDYVFTPKINKSRRWKHTKKDLITNCHFCAEQLAVKYILPRKQYSKKNNWGYWTGKKVFADKHACDSCLIKIHQGGIIKWVDDLEKADTFYTYLSRQTFKN